jgi:hypothetical protein
MDEKDFMIGKLQKTKGFSIYNTIPVVNYEDLEKTVIGNGLRFLHIYMQTVNIYHLQLSIPQRQAICKRPGLKTLTLRSILFISLHLKRVGQMINEDLSGWRYSIGILGKRHVMGKIGEYYG